VVDAQLGLEPEMLGDRQCLDEQIVLLDVARQCVDHAEVCHLGAVHTQLTVDQQTAGVPLVEYVQQRRLPRPTVTHRRLTRKYIPFSSHNHHHLSLSKRVDKLQPRDNLQALEGIKTSHVVREGADGNPLNFILPENVLVVEFFFLQNIIIEAGNPPF